MEDEAGGDKLQKVFADERESKTVLDSGFHTVDSGFKVLHFDSLSVELGFRIPIGSGFPDS